MLSTTIADRVALDAVEAHFSYSQLMIKTFVRHPRRRTRWLSIAVNEGSPSDITHAQNFVGPDVDPARREGQPSEITKRRVNLARSMTELTKETIAYNKETTRLGR
ncbi:hypothetical protein PENSPDRAFT_691416 [Peniophora sp. CONT]|nr:hypothetical protein PENSPDRAFT_691416 [Peniophora sp. CONT]